MVYGDSYFGLAKQLQGRIQTTRPLLPLIRRIARRPRIGPKAWPGGALNARRPRIGPKVWPGGINDGSGPRIGPKAWPSRGKYWSGPPFAANPWPTTEYPLRRSASHRNNSSRCGWNELPKPERPQSCRRPSLSALRRGSGRRPWADCGLRASRLLRGRRRRTLRRWHR